MGIAYHVLGAVNAGADKTAATLISSTAGRPRMYEFLISSSTTPADIAAKWAVQRFTADGTGTTTPTLPLDPGDPASRATAKNLYTVEPTVTANQFLFRAAVNMRATVRWSAYDMTKALKCPATAANGLALKTVTAGSTAGWDPDYWFEE